jgi:hypothetical protein
MERWSDHVQEVTGQACLTEKRFSGQEVLMVDEILEWQPRTSSNKQVEMSWKA